MGRKRIYTDNAAKQAAWRVRRQVTEIQHKRQGDYSTPQDLFEHYDRIHHFTLDVCATAANAKCPSYFTSEQDGLQQPWHGTCWMNPPYHQAEIPKWIRKAYEESQRGAVVVTLLPARTGSAWFHEVVLPHAEVTFLPGRIKFDGLTTNAMENSMIAVFGGQCASALAHVRCLGCDAVKACPVGEGWLCVPCAQAQWQRIEPPPLVFPRWIFHPTLPACIIETPEAMAALGDGWRYQPYP